MPPKTIWVAEKERELWERAENYAKSHRLTMSALIMNALESYLADKDRQ